MQKKVMRFKKSSIFEKVMKKSLRCFLVPEEVKQYQLDSKDFPLKSITPKGFFILNVELRNEYCDNFFSSLLGKKVLKSQKISFLSTQLKQNKNEKEILQKKLNKFERKKRQQHLYRSHHSFAPKIRQIKDKIKELFRTEDFQDVKDVFDAISKMDLFKKVIQVQVIKKSKKKFIEGKLIDMINKKMGKAISNAILTIGQMSKSKYNKIKKLLDDICQKINTELNLRTPKLKFLYHSKSITRLRNENLKKYKLKIERFQVKKTKMINQKIIEKDVCASFTQPKNVLKLLIKSQKQSFLGWENFSTFTRQDLQEIESGNINSLFVQNCANFASIQKCFHHNSSQKEVPIRLINILLTYDGLKSYKWSKKGTSHHSHFSMKVGKIIGDIAVHEEKETAKILTTLKEKGVFQFFNQTKYIFVNGVIWKTHFVSVNDIPGHCALLNIAWGVDWLNRLPTHVRINNVWKNRWDVQSFADEGVEDWEQLIIYMKDNYCLFDHRFLDPREVEIVYCSGHGNEIMFAELCMQITTKLYNFKIPKLDEEGRIVFDDENKAVLTKDKSKYEAWEVFCEENNIPFDPSKYILKGSQYKCFVGFGIHKILFKHINDLNEIVKNTSFENWMERYLLFGQINMSCKLFGEKSTLFLEEIEKEENVLTKLTVEGRNRAYFIVYKEFFFPRFQLRKVLGDINTSQSESLGYIIKLFLKTRTNHNINIVQKFGTCQVMELTKQYNGVIF